MRIGIQRLDYPERRNITFGGADSGIEYIPSPGTVSWENTEFGPDVKASNFFRQYAFRQIRPLKVDCWHFFNTIPVQGIRFVTTFETAVPRWWGCRPETLRGGWQLLASESCVKLFALSKNARSIQEDELATCDVQVRKRILEKTEILYPPQQVLVKRESISMPDRIPMILFVGGDFLRKGGYELVRALDSLLRDKKQVQCQIISGMEVQGDKNLPWNHDGVRRLAEAHSIINQHAEIKLERSLPNHEVLNLMRRADLLALPSYGDTFGYVVLEAQSCGCPALTTNVRAFPEINNNSIGWCCDIPIDYQGKYDQWKHEFQSVSQALTLSIRDQLTDLLEASDAKRIAKRLGCIDNIEKMNAPVMALRRLKQAYQKS